MVSEIWGKKIGMTQVFADDKVIPVTAVDVGNWIITNIKTKERDGYNAIQVGCLRKRYVGEKPLSQWFKKPKSYFSVLREVKVDEIPQGISVGQDANFLTVFKEGDQVDVFGTTKGRGFAGVVKRWDFNGPPASHGATMGKAPGAMSFMRSEGRVIKGKKLPGHMGTERRVMKNLAVVKVLQDGPVVLIKGSVPGHAGSLLFLKKR